MSNAIKANPIKTAWRRVKDRMKLTWVGWFYICARREPLGSVLLMFLFLAVLTGSFGFSGYMAVRPYTSWDELPCQTGTLTKAVSVDRHSTYSSGTLVDDVGGVHKFYGSAFHGASRLKLQPFFGQKITVCYLSEIVLWPPFYYPEAALIVFPDGTSDLNKPRSPAGTRAFHIKLMKGSLLWFGLPLLLWLLKRYARTAWRARQAHLESLVSGTQNQGTQT